MLQNLRRHAQGWFAAVIIALLSLIFALWGVQYYLGGHTKNPPVAKVDGTAITQHQLNDAYKRLRLQNNIRAIPSEAQQLVLKQRALHQLIATKILSNAAWKMGFRITGPQLNAAVMQMPLFQKDNAYSPARFQQMLRVLNYTEDQFLGDLHALMLAAEFQTGLTQSAFMLPNEAQTLWALMHQKRDVTYLILDPADWESKVDVTDDEIAAFYKQHADQFMTPEALRLAYIELSANDLAKRMSKQKAEEQFAEDSEQLADLVYTDSDSLAPAAKTLGLAVRTTDLFTKTDPPKGFLTHPNVMNAAWSDAVLHQGENSKPLELDDNHVVVLRVAEHQPSRVKSLAEVKSDIVHRIRIQKARKKVKSVGETLVDALAHAKEGPEKVLALYKLSWQKKTGVARSMKGMPQPLLGFLFSLPLYTTPKDYVGLMIPQIGYVVGRLDARVEGAAATPQDQQALAKAFSKASAQFEYGLYLTHQVGKAKIKILDTQLNTANFF